LTSSLVVQLACDGQNKSIATQLKKQQKHPSLFPFRPFSFLFLCAFPIMKTGPKTVPNAWESPYMRHIKTGSHLVSFIFKWCSSCGGMNDIEDGWCYVQSGVTQLEKQRPR
jgi:hypothetical protein